MSKGTNAVGKEREERREGKQEEMTKESGGVGAGAGMLIILQIGSRMINLLIAQLQIRFTTAEAFGAVNIQLELVLGLILTFSREGFRNALSRQKVSLENARERSINNVALLPVLFGIPMSFLVMKVYQTILAPIELTNHSHFSISCTIFLFGALLELICEPLFVLALRNVQFGPRIWAEGAALTTKGASTLISMIVLQRSTETLSKVNLQQSILPFAIGQFCFGATFLFVFVIHSIKQRGLGNTFNIYIFQRQNGSIKTFDKESLSLSISMTRQNAVKHILGEADKFAVAKLGSLSEQGAYALASNYGSLVARLLYQPIEESSRLRFATSLGSSSIKQTNAAVQHAYDLLFNLSRFYVLFTLYLITFCPPLTTPLLLIIAGKRWALETSAPQILAVYGALYLPAMAFNGLLEGFLQATASPSQLAKYDGILIGASISFVVLLTSLTILPNRILNFSPISSESALIIAGTFSTCLRANYCFRFAKSFFSKSQHEDIQTNSSSKNKSFKNERNFSFSSILPNSITTLLFFSIALLHYSIAINLSAKDWHLPWSLAAKSLVFMGILDLILITFICYRGERETLMGAIQAIRGRRRS